MSYTVRSQSEKLKRKKAGPVVHIYYLVMYVEDKTFGILSAKQIKIDEDDHDVGTVDFKGTVYEVEIIKSG